MTNTATLRPAKQRTTGRRLPPHDTEAERSLLGAMLLNRAAIDTATERLTAEDFYNPSHGHIYQAILGLHTRSQPADPVTVADELRRNGLLDTIGGPHVLTDIQNDTPATSNAARYTTIVEEHALLRRIIATGHDIAEIGYELPDDVPAALDHAETMMFNVAQRRVVDTLAPAADVMEANLDWLETITITRVTGTPTGFTDFDHYTGGLQPSALYVLGARPSVGKTALALNIASHVALDQDQPVLIFSLEMSRRELGQRLICAQARLDSRRVRHGALTDTDWAKISHITAAISAAPLWIDDNPNLTIMEIRAKARRLQARTGRPLGLIVVDYLQLMTGRSSAENRQVEVAEISRGLKLLARELNTPIVALSQLSRSLEARADKRPMLSDLKESGALEQDADVVLFLYRDELYNPGTRDCGIAEVHIAKHRNGPTGTSRLAFLAPSATFANLSRQTHTTTP